MTTLQERLADARLYLLATGALCSGPLVETVARAIEGGVDVVQLREKHLGDGEFLELSERVGRVVQQSGAIYLLNDRVAVGQITECDGVHLGQEDLPLSLARGLLGDDSLIGISTHDLEQAREAEFGGADYIGVGPAFTTGTKATGYEPKGPEEIARIARSVSIPAFAIGGITLENLPLLRTAGIRRVAVSSAILSAEDPESAAREMRQILTS
jgi:thiamine-phosphate pyrophosphorylase